MCMTNDIDKIREITGYEPGKAFIYGFNEEDTYWFSLSESCESPVTSITSMNATQMIVSFTQSSTSAYHLCYQFYGNDVMYYEDYTLLVKELTSITATSEPTIAIWLRAKTFTFSGIGINEGDHVKYVPANSDCSTVVTFMKDPVTEEVVDYYTLDATHSIQTYFTVESTEEEPYQVCYQFNGHEWMNYGKQGAYGESSPFYLVVFGRPNVISTGDKDVFIQGIP